MNIQDTTTLLGVISKQKPLSTYWLSQFFGRQMNFTTEEIKFDEVAPKRRIAPFVSPVVQGRVMRNEGYITRSFRPAYTKPKHIVDPNRVFQRVAGEAIGGSLSPDQRFNAAIAENLRIENESITVLENWMAAMAIIYGEVTISGEDYPTQVVSFARDASLTNTLAGTARWGEADADPLGDIALMRKRAFQKSGARIDRLTMGLDAFDRFFSDADVKDMLKTELGSVPRTSDSFMSAFGEPGAPYEWRGVLQGANGQGRLEVYTYAETYDDADGNEQTVMDSNAVVGTGGAIDGVRCYGAIRDKRAGLQALSRFPKVWDNEDPSVTYTMTQSAPLMVPSNADNSFLLQVHDAA